MPSILFLSSAEISLPLFRALHEDSRFEIKGLICQPDRMAGRGMELKAPASKVLAQEFGLNVFQPEKLSADVSLLEHFQEDPPDFLLTFAYGQILNNDWLSLAKIAPVNVHTSLLPKYRGASPIQSALLNGDEVSGISVMRMERSMDTGPVYVQHELSCAGMNAGQLHDALAEIAAEKLPEDLFAIFEGLSAEPQEGGASYCRKISSEDSRMNFDWTAEQAMNAFRAYSPWPCLWSEWNGKRVKLLDVKASNTELEAGLVQQNGVDVLLGMKSGSLVLKRIQMAGKKAMNIDDFIRGQGDFLSSDLSS